MASCDRMNTILAAAGVIVATISLVLVLLVYAALPDKPDQDLAAGGGKLAGELADYNLPEAAIEEYQKILDRGALTAGERGAISYLIGRIYFDDIGDYEKAAAYYIRARALDENGSYYAEAGKNLIACLERMGRRLDARRELDAQVSDRPGTAGAPGKLVARVGSHDITAADFNAALEALPPEIRTRLSSPMEKRKFLDQMIGRELIYRAALREGMDRDSRLQKELKEFEKDFLVQYYTQNRIAPTIKPDSSELMLYFNANKAKYGDKPFENIRENVMQDYMNYVGQKAVQDYIGTLLQAEPVQVYEENLK